MKVCFVASECVPFVKTGGLADVAGALPRALEREGCQVKLFLPLYKSIDVSRHALIKADELSDIPVLIGGKIVTFDGWYGKLPDSQVEVYFIACPRYYNRPTIYTNAADEDERFILFQHAVLQILQRYHWSPDILHCNDWQTGLLPAFLKLNYKWDRLFDDTVSIFTIHNIEYQGRFAPTTVAKAGLPPDQFYPGSPLEFDGDLSVLKAGIMYADMISTVSETYAREIQTPAYGAGLEGILAARKDSLVGVLNGIDTDSWNPRKDELIERRFSEKRLGAKLKNKQALLKHVKLPQDDDIPVIGMITRLANQKGVNLLKPILPDLMKLPLRMIVLGSGEKPLEALLRRASKKYPEKFSASIAYDNELAHLITAGSDIFLMPSRYEPCGLNQMYSLAYGTVPIVRRTGGLADTVKDYHEYYKRGNGFVFNDFDAELLYLTILRALDMYKSKRVWREMVKRGMTRDFSWDASAKRYVQLYKKAIAKRGV